MAEKKETKVNVRSVEKRIIDFIAFLNPPEGEKDELEQALKLTWKDEYDDVYEDVINEWLCEINKDLCRLLAALNGFCCRTNVKGEVYIYIPD